MKTQKAMGSKSLVKRLSAQVGNTGEAIAILKKRGDMTSNGELTAHGKIRNNMTAKERAVDRAAKASGKAKSKYTYNPKTNRATLKG